MRINLLQLAFLLSGTSLAQVPSYVPTNGLLSWYPFNGNPNDESGNGNTGTVFGAELTANRVGAVNSAYAFNGANSYISLSGNTGVVNDFTVSFWIRPLNSSDGYLLDRDICATANDWSIYWSNNGQLGLRYGMNGNDYFIQGVSAAVGEWHHIVAIRETSTSQLRLYLNSQQAGSTAFPSGAFGNTSLPIVVGESNCNPGVNPNFLGDIDDIGVWSRALSVAEIQSLFAGEEAPPCVSSTDVALSGLNASYQSTDPASTLTGIPEGGVFLGPGVSGSTFNPASAGAGQHTVTYTYVDQNGCVNSTGLCTVVSEGMGVNDPDGFMGGVRVFPNPTDGIFTLELEIEGLVTLTVHDARGRQVVNQTFVAQCNRSMRVIDLSREASGTYMLRISVGVGSTSQQLVKR